MAKVTTVITPIELAAIRAVVESDLNCFGSVIEQTRPELYQALVSAKMKLARLVGSSESMVSA